jgi:hypothetical protein
LVRLRRFGDGCPFVEDSRDINKYRNLLRRFAVIAVRHPMLVPPLLAAAWRFRRRDWFRKPPFLPIPPQEYIAWRLHTAYGGEDVVPPARDLSRYLRWAAWVRKRSHR